MNVDLLAGLYEALDALRDDLTCRVVVLTGAGPGFCAGLDLAEGVQLPDLPGMGRARAGMRVQQYIANLIPLMRAAAATDHRRGQRRRVGRGTRPHARLRHPDRGRERPVQRRVHQGRLVGVRHRDELDPAPPDRRVPRYELMLTGRFVDSEEALRIGLVTSVAADDVLTDAALAEAELILANGPFGVRMTKEVMWSQLEIGSLQAGIDLENRTQVLSSFAGDLEEAMAAFLEKRPPSFTD